MQTVERTLQAETDKNAELPPARSVLGEPTFVSLIRKTLCLI